ncbi:hypothetical protein BpHYR1_026992 [Brachionus plicatilis]|uniref:Uncharacterized protein n=1 Tax=Brachionus plicatilis TaxID=10195 RepID=A0A3M7SQ57_BRAPC|nr:hypothetical protein BpHYR1_026992 [Brachionus plicatilis]
MFTLVPLGPSVRSPSLDALEHPKTCSANESETKSVQINVQFRIGKVKNQAKEFNKELKQQDQDVISVILSILINHLEYFVKEDNNFLSCDFFLIFAPKLEKNIFLFLDVLRKQKILFNNLIKTKTDCALLPVCNCEEPQILLFLLIVPSKV